MTERSHMTTGRMVLTPKFIRYANEHSENGSPRLDELERLYRDYQAISSSGYESRETKWLQAQLASKGESLTVAKAFVARWEPRLEEMRRILRERGILFA